MGQNISFLQSSEYENGVYHNQDIHKYLELISSSFQKRWVNYKAKLVSRKIDAVRVATSWYLNQEDPSLTTLQ